MLSREGTGLSDQSELSVLQLESQVRILQCLSRNKGDTIECAQI